jgi:hypothetical protein
MSSIESKTKDMTLHKNEQLKLPDFPELLAP